MRIAISNIAWDASEDAAVADLLARNGIDAIDVAPSKYFPDPRDADRTQARKARDWWAGRGIEVTGMQALLFGAAGLNIFGEAAARAEMLDRLSSLCRVAGWMGARKLVFGSPRNRDRKNLSDEVAMSMAVDFFRSLGDAAEREGVFICVEANPERYGCNFMTTTCEAAEVVRAVGHPAIRLHLDSGTIAINGEDPAEVVRANADIIGHAHASEPDLVPLGDGNAPHADLGCALNAAIPQTVVAIEMVATKSEPHLDAIERSLLVAIAAYGDAAVYRRGGR